MIVFAVLAKPENTDVEAAVSLAFPNDHLKVAPGQYLVAARTTAVDVSNTLGITNGAKGTAIVLSTSSYYGWAGNDIWEWLKVKVSAP